MRNIFRRQTETTAPSLHERAAALREGLSRQDTAPGERADLYDRLLTLYAEDREARPVQGREDGTVASRAAILVSNRLWALAREIIAMPPPKTMDGLRATALASAVLCEAEHSQEDPTALAAIGLTRAALSVTGTPLPPGFVGFGDETDHEERDDALFAKPGSVPAWAIAEIESQDVARYGDPTRRPHPFAPADLADACLWAIRHRAWIDRTAGKENWPDRRLDAEIDKTNAVFTRAIKEPSTSLREITAKAALALEDFERFTIRSNPTPDDGTRIVHTVLREVVGVGREASTSIMASQPTELPLSALVPTVDFAGASMRELLAIRDAADMLCSVANAAVSQYRNRLSDHPSGAVRLNRSGLLMRWLSDALCHVITAAEKEARGRSPEDSDDRQLRLSMLAVSTIDSDDPAETAAFARELLAMVEP